MTLMTPSEQCKAAGLKSLAELAKISSASTRTLINWHKDKPALFATVLAGAVVIEAGWPMRLNVCKHASGTLGYNQCGLKRTLNYG